MILAFLNFDNKTEGDVRSGLSLAKELDMETDMQHLSNIHPQADYIIDYM
jgi:hypothetical protein